MSFNIISFIVSCVLVLAYYLYLGRKSRRAPSSRVHALNAKIRARWVHRVMSSGKMDILAIQTLRNSLMAANFMATTAVLLIIGILNLSDQIGAWAEKSQFSFLANSVSADLWYLKIALLVLDYAVAFYCFSTSIRFFNHVGYMINLGCDIQIEETIFKQTCAYLNRAGSYYMYGTRAFFFSLPVIMWFFGPIFLIPATLTLIAGLAVLDKVPKCDLSEKDRAFITGQSGELL
jgi:uncharacterized membrane protein